jgi:hypothetical protein
MQTFSRIVRVWDKALGDYRNVSVVVEIDVTAVAEQYAAKALANKSKVAKQCQGAVAVRVRQ